MASNISLSEILNDFPDVNPQIYCYITPTVSENDGYIKIGYTDREDVEERIDEQLHTVGVSHKTLWHDTAVRSDGTTFTDKDIHRLLERKGFKKKYFNGDTNNEWFNCKLKDVQVAYKEIKEYKKYEGNRTEEFKMRDEQLAAVEQTADYFTRMKVEEPDIVPKFLWNAKMRFGKTFATYQLAKKMGMKRILVLTFKPAVEEAWKTDLDHHVDFNGWQFVSNNEAKFETSKIDEQYNNCDKDKPIVVFGSFQDLLGVNENGGIKAKNEFIHTDNWDMVVLDEYHFGAWRDNAKKLFEKQDDENVDFDYDEYSKTEVGNTLNESWLPITTNYYLYLSGTPFRALNSGEFIEEQIFNWTYSDEQNAKEKWDKSRGENPYEALPKMVMLTYKIPDSITAPAINEGYDEFDINEFFKAEFKKDVKKAQFIYKDYVQKWLDLIQGKGNFVDGIKLGSEKPPMPYSDTTLLGVLIHTLWFMPSIASCHAMYNLLKEPQNKFFNDYKIIVCAGTEAGVGLDALEPVQNAMGDPLKTKTITLSCGKLTTGVTIRPWSGVFMLRNLKSPETYFQTAFRVQSPWTTYDDQGNKLILKKECYVFDFALERALKQISDYSMKLSVKDNSPEKKVAEFINFLPVLAFDGAGMNQISAQDILDITFSGTSATLLAKRWQTALLVHVDNETLKKLQANTEALAALQKMESFRTLNAQIETIINKSEKIKQAKTTGEKQTPAEKKEISEEEKQMKSLRKQIQENLLKLASRIPAFMYLTDYREQCIKDVITQIEPALFKKVTGLDVKDFDLLCSIGLFDPEKMNQGIFGFRRYENSSLSYTGVDMHEGEDVGGWDTVLKREEYDELFKGQQATLTNFEEIMTPVEDEKIEVSKNNETKKVANTKTSAKEKMPIISIGNKVLHKIFGEGSIVKFKQNNKFVDVKFAEGVKTFGTKEAFVTKNWLELIKNNDDYVDTDYEYNLDNNSYNFAIADNKAEYDTADNKKDKDKN